MPVKNITIDNINPLINYQPAGAWLEGNPALDGFYSSYKDDTFTLCTALGASAQFTFNGTGIWIYGAKRANHGLYNVTLDGGKSQTFNGAGNQIFQTPLFSQTGLSNTLHTIMITNSGADPNHSATGNDYLDIDFVVWESSFGTDAEIAEEATVQDNASNFAYSPPSAWNTNPQYLVNFFGETGHATSTGGASTTLTFTGDAIQIFGSVGPDNAPYSVELDGGSPVTYNATKLSDYQQVLLYYADNLGPGQHNVQMTNDPAVSGQNLNLDYALIDSVPSVEGASGSSKHSLGIGAIVGIVIGALAIFGAAGVAFFLWSRGHRRRMDTISRNEKPSPMTRIFESPADPFALSVPAAAEEVEDASPIHTAHTQLAQLAQPVQSAHSYYPPELLKRGDDSKLNLLVMRPPGSSHGGSSISDGSENGERRPRTARTDSYSSRPLPIPRPRTAERPIDMGHIPTSGEMPPPDYSDATNGTRSQDSGHGHSNGQSNGQSNGHSKQRMWVAN